MKRDSLNGMVVFFASLVCLSHWNASRAADAETEATNISAVQTNVVVAAATETNVPQMEAEQALREFLQLQEQRHEERLAEERSRRELEITAAAAERMTARLEAIERAFLARGERDFEAMQNSNRTLLVAATIFAGVSLLTIVLTSFLQWRAVNRLSEAATAAAGVRLLSGSAVAPDPTPQLIGPAANARWLGVTRRLEQRIRELEEGVSPSAVDSLNTHDVSPEGKLSDRNDVASMLLGKGQTLLNLGKADEALQCFDAVLIDEPARVEAMLGKGMALERLKRFTEAIECYDRAGASDPSSTRAWLCKAAVLNRQERFAEALVCYERALRLP